ncbi:MAG TPA: TolC family protein [Casimicrobiaceae bacterium]|nr:TolC family protein [Casimicrobiaceae bacterium]
MSNRIRTTRRAALEFLFVAARAVAVAFACAGLAVPVHAEGTLSLDQALKLARTRSQALVAQDAAASAARDMAVSAGQLPDPTLTMGINNLPVTGPDKFSLTDDFMTMASIGLMQEFTREEKRKARAARYDREAEAAQEGRKLALANLERDTAIAWFDRYYQEAVRTLLLRQRDEAKLQVETADAAYRGSRGAQSDVIAARQAVAMVDDRIAQSDRQVRTSKTMLARWIGTAAEDPLAAPPATNDIPSQLAGMEAQWSHHPAIALLTKQEETAKAEADVARASKQADWSVSLMYSQRGPNYSNMVSVFVSVPLQWDQGSRQDREMSAKFALADQARAQREDLLRAHEAEALAMWQEWQSNRGRLVRYDESLIPLAAQRTQAALTAYRGGSGTLAAVLDARRAEIDTQIERVRLEQETARLWAQLNYLVPTDDPMRTVRR